MSESDFKRQFDEATKDVVRGPFVPGGRIDSNGFLDMRWAPDSSYAKWLNKEITLYLSYEGEEGPADRVVGMWIDLRHVLNEMEHTADLEIVFGMKDPPPITEADIDPRPFDEWFAELTAEMEEKYKDKPYEPGGWIDEQGFLNIYWENAMCYGEWLNHAITLYRSDRQRDECAGNEYPGYDRVIGAHVDLRCVLNRQDGDLDIIKVLAS